MLSGEYAGGLVDGFAGLFNSFGEEGADAFQIFLNSPALPVTIITVVVFWLLRRRNRR